MVVQAFQQPLLFIPLNNDEPHGALYVFFRKSDSPTTVHEDSKRYGDSKEKPSKLAIGRHFHWHSSRHSHKSQL